MVAQRFCAEVALLLLIPAAAPAHEWYPPSCCGGTDCQPVECESLREEDHGALSYSPREAAYPPQLPQSYRFEREKVLPSHDARCHVCINAGKPLCAFTIQGF